MIAMKNRSHLVDCISELSAMGYTIEFTKSISDNGNGIIDLLLKRNNHMARTTINHTDLELAPDGEALFVNILLYLEDLYKKNILK